jgi:regulator of nucleoside diphosphate kinase
MGSHVRFRDETARSAQDAQLVYPKDTNPEKKRISILTLVGAALIGLPEGQTMSRRTRDGREKTLTVLKVRDQGPRAD